MRDFDPHRIASEWHSGQGSALYAYASTDRIPTETFKDRLVHEIERAMAHADDEQLDELEYLLMHVEESHPDLYPEDEMHEQVVYEGSDVADEDDKGQWYDSTSEKENPAMKEADTTCEVCGGMKTEGTCECSMTESESGYEDDGDLSENDFAAWLKKTASKVKDVAMTDVGGPEGFLAPSEKTQRHGKASKGGESDDFRAWKEKQRKSESLFRQAVFQIVREMKLGVAGINPFGFGGGSEVDDKDVAHFLLKKKDDTSKEPEKKEKAKSAQKKSKKKR